MKIYLDDVRFIPDVTRTECKNASQFVQLVFTHLWEIEEISFDHDLWAISYGESEKKVCCDEWSFGEDAILEKNGYDCLYWFVATYRLLRLPFPKMLIHSANPIGAERMNRLLQEVEAIRSHTSN